MRRLRPGSRPRIHRHRIACLGCEGLESRWLLATFVVTSLDDSGPGTLRQAIVDLDSLGDTSGAPANTITFNIAGNGPWTIEPLTPLPDITKCVLIDGRSQG